ncbi:phosphatidylinositol/phosphatidylcholine transfer protein SFH2 isoform X2 [Nicotiana tabacum]|uniref:Phosphatidylinositol/phosphatidylcholine transfer protein SFH2 isoform X2 n=1 Tax=Nicotiana tabacum TaxID=4097 RepID=A0A1S4BYS7_TOBAC|nr:PREDICTED: SEC14 cytosolic factor-like isoform X2 [Nicotiana tabacum]
MDTNEEIGLTQMRKSVENLGSSTDGYGEQTLMRFLIARSMDPQKAAKMFSQWQKWRAEMVPIGYISDSEVADELEAKKIYLQGLSKNGHPVMIVKVNKHFSSKDQVQFKKFVVHLLDKTIASAFRGREIGNEKLIGILDLQNITYSNVDARGLITGFQFLQIRIVRSEEEREEFIREVGEDVLPEEYGGRAKIVLLQDVAVNY